MPKAGQFGMSDDHCEMATRVVIPTKIAMIPSLWYRPIRSFKKRWARITVSTGDEFAIGVTIATKPK